MLSNLSVKHLRAFIALATHRNFTRAAQATHLSQSAFSTLIQTLEEQAGSRLFERTTRHVDLSADGRRFEEVARRLLADFETAFEDLRDHAERRKGRVSIAALPSLAGVMVCFCRVLGQVTRIEQDEAGWGELRSQAGEFSMVKIEMGDDVKLVASIKA